jgi:hypothetical protein
MTNTTVLVVVIIGILARALFPYLEKAREAAKSGKPFAFQWKYLVAPALTCILAIWQLPEIMLALPADANGIWAILMFVLAWEVPNKLRLAQKVFFG